MPFTLLHVPSTTTSATRPGCASTHGRNSDAGRAPANVTNVTDVTNVTNVTDVTDVTYEIDVVT